MKLFVVLVGLVLVTQQIPTRPHKPVFHDSVNGPRQLEIAYNRRTRTVVVTLAIRDRNGYFVPNLHPDDFSVDEDGIRQPSAIVQIEHLTVTLAVLVEGGSRYQELNDLLANELPVLTEPITDALQPGDRVGLFAYRNGVQTLVPFGHHGRALDTIVESMTTSGFSEANLYDALITVVNRASRFRGEKAVLLISTGVDTFSHATFDEAVARVQREALPVYVISLAGLVQQAITGSTNSPLSKINWQQAVERLKSLAGVSGARTYLPTDDLDVTAIYDDMIEHLRVRYVIRYESTNTRRGRSTVRVSLVDPQTRGPLRLEHEDGAAEPAAVSFQGTYTR